MLGLSTILHPPIPIQPISIPLSFLHPNPSLPLKTQTQNPKISKGFVLYAENGNGLSQEEPKNGEESGAGNGLNGGGGGDDFKKDRWPIFNLKLGDLLDPDPDNLLAIGLTGLLSWASVQVLAQLFFISLAILVAALKYSFIAALLVIILITLL